MKKIQASFYQNSSGREPVKEFLKELSKGDKFIVGSDIKTVEFGWPIGMPVCRPLSEGLYEVRSSLSTKREVRIIFFIYKSNMILLHIFIKKTQKTPDSDLKLARTRKQEVENDK
ncbi:type II toxin-antitoxin system RelE/ParE family toxin [Candidatus Jidaibacter acanthamoebae]|uniref:type II toxin-antitoxin system RelE/ParE family toxin n=1 Tax=Candidatus Jidaibacter acanthamoebae TaxID=86105 RepID=UPI001EF9CD67|nr:type II toxin-antitoxin system RelE/ParE family toxin [Candidatus Jidaibacter acanthamoeba]